MADGWKENMGVATDDLVAASNEMRASFRQNNLIKLLGLTFKNEVEKINEFDYSQPLLMGIQLKFNRLTTGIYSVMDSIQLAEIPPIRDISTEVAKNMEIITRAVKSFGTIGTMADLVKKNAKLVQAQGNLQSLNVSDIGISAITASAKDFTNNWAGVTTLEFMQVAHTIKSELGSISDDSLNELSKMVSLTALATNNTSQEMSKFFSTGYNLYKGQFDSTEEFAKQFSNAVSSSYQNFGIQSSDLMKSLKAISSSANKMGISLSEQLSVLGIAKTEIGSIEVVSKGYNDVISSIVEAQKKLNIEFTDSFGAMLPMADIIDRIQDKYGELSTEKLEATLKEAFGSDEAVAMLTKLIDKTDELRFANAELNNEMMKGAITKEMALISQQGREFDILIQRMDELCRTVGSILAPMFIFFVDILGSAVQWLSSFIEDFGLLFKVIGAGIVILTAFHAIMSAIQMVVAYQKILTLQWALAQNVLSFATTAVSKAILFMGKAAMASPLTLVLVGVALLAILVMKNFDKVKETILKAFNAIKSAGKWIFRFLGIGGESDGSEEEDMPGDVPQTGIRGSSHDINYDYNQPNDHDYMFTSEPQDTPSSNSGVQSYYEQTAYTNTSSTKQEIVNITMGDINIAHPDRSFDRDFVKEEIIAMLNEMARQEYMLQMRMVNA